MLHAGKRRVVGDYIREVVERSSRPCEAITKILDFTLNQEEEY